MGYSELRELMHLRHELRRYSGAARAEVDPAEVGRLLDRLSSLAALDPAEQAQVTPEIERWRFRLGLA